MPRTPGVAPATGVTSCATGFASANEVGDDLQRQSIQRDEGVRKVAEVEPLQQQPNGLSA